jgi:hypothetical protein
MTGKPCFASGIKNEQALMTGRRLQHGFNDGRLSLPDEPARVWPETRRNVGLFPHIFANRPFQARARRSSVV